jgi:Bacterial protein of unknown function (DUF922)
VSVTFSDTERAYTDVHGKTLTDVAAVIAQQGEAAKAEWFPPLAYDRSATVTVRTKITMPRWPEYTSAPQAEKDEWDRFFAALQAHEEGHIDLVRQQLSGIDDQLAGLSSDQANSAWTAALQQLQDASDSYDTDTDHGRNQGTIINLGP